MRTEQFQPRRDDAPCRHALCRVGIALLLCLMVSSLCTGCFATARNSEEVTVDGAITI